MINKQLKVSLFRLYEKILNDQATSYFHHVQQIIHPLIPVNRITATFRRKIIYTHTPKKKQKKTKTKTG